MRTFELKEIDGKIVVTISSVSIARMFAVLSALLVCYFCYAFLHIHVEWLRIDYGSSIPPIGPERLLDYLGIPFWTLVTAVVMIYFLGFSDCYQVTRKHGRRFRRIVRSKLIQLLISFTIELLLILMLHDVFTNWNGEGGFRKYIVGPLIQPLDSAYSKISGVNYGTPTGRLAFILFALIAFCTLLTALIYEPLAHLSDIPVDEKQCAKCGYNLEGTLAANQSECPECGQATAESSRG